MFISYVTSNWAHGFMGLIGCTGFLKQNCTLWLQRFMDWTYFTFSASGPSLIFSRLKQKYTYMCI